MSERGGDSSRESHSRRQRRQAVLSQCDDDGRIGNARKPCGPSFSVRTKKAPPVYMVSFGFSFLRSAVRGPPAGAIPWRIERPVESGHA